MSERIIVLDLPAYSLALTLLENEFKKCKAKMHADCQRCDGKHCYYDVLKRVLDSFDNYHESGMLFGKVEMAGKKFR